MPMPILQVQVLNCLYTIKKKAKLYDSKKTAIVLTEAFFANPIFTNVKKIADFNSDLMC